MTNLIEYLKGKKTFFVCAASVLYALSALATGHMDTQAAVEVILAALGGASMRSAIGAPKQDNSPTP